jgi:hypothetical protein
VEVKSHVNPALLLSKSPPGSCVLEAGFGRALVPEIQSAAAEAWILTDVNF